MHVVHTADDPPIDGRIAFATRGCTWNRRNDPKRIVPAAVHKERRAGTRTVAA